MSQTAAQQFAAEYAEGVVPAMRKALDAGKKRTKYLLYLVMGATYWHVASYLIWHTKFGLFGIVVPAIIDLGMLQMLDILQTKGMHRQAKRFAVVAAAVLGLISGTFNVIAADDVFTAFGFASLVLVAVGTKIAVSLMRPDLKAIADAEQEVTGTQQDTDLEADVQARIDAAVKAAVTKAQRNWTAKQNRERKQAEAAAPISPAGPLGSAIIVPTAAELRQAVYAA